MRSLLPLLLLLLPTPPDSARAESGGTAPGPVAMRVGYFANITHAQAVLGFADKSFERAMGPGARLETTLFNAGPSAIEAIFAGALDLAYVGPNPAINGYIKSRGEAVRIVAGACSGGARLVVRKAAGIKGAADLKGKRLATPQLGNTQDVAARAWLEANGLKAADRGGDVQVLPIKNADQLSLFQRGEIDAAWAPEPWATRLIREADGVELLDERKLWEGGRFATTVVLVSTKFLKERPELVRKFVAEHVAVTERIRRDPVAARGALNAEIARLSGKGLAPGVLEEAWSRLELTADPLREPLLKAADAAFRLGFLGRGKPDLAGLFDLSFLPARR